MNLQSAAGDCANAVGSVGAVGCAAIAAGAFGAAGAGAGALGEDDFVSALCLDICFFPVFFAAADSWRNKRRIEDDGVARTGLELGVNVVPEYFVLPALEHRVMCCGDQDRSTDFGLTSDILGCPMDAGETAGVSATCTGSVLSGDPDTRFVLYCLRVDSARW